MKLNPFHPLAHGLIACWAINEGGGKQIFDLVGNNTATLSGAQWTETGLTFDGVSDNASGNLSHDDLKISIVQGIKSHSTGESGKGRTFIVNTDGVDGYGAILHDSAYNIKAAFADEYPNENISISNVVITQDQEHNIAVTHDNAAAPKIYVDGAEVSSYASQTFYGALTSSITDFVIAANSSSGAYAYEGDIRYTFVYDRVLTPTEIMWLDIDPYGMFIPDFTPAKIQESAAATAINAIITNGYGSFSNVNLVITEGYTSGVVAAGKGTVFGLENGENTFIFGGQVIR